MTVHCPRALVFTGGAHYVSVHQLNIEHAASGWWVPVYDIDDASNYGKGEVNWHVVLAGSGVSTTFLVNGASGIRYASIALGLSLTNPMTTAGDLIRGGSSGVPTRLAMGSALQRLRVNSGGTALEYAGDPVLIQFACSDETTALTTGTGKVTFRAPFAFTLTGVRASVNTAPTGATLLTVDINEAGTTVLSTKLTFDASEKTTVTAATAAVISDSSIADDAEISIDIDAIGSTVAGAGLKVTLIGNR
jgi:hypothetical protein